MVLRQAGSTYLPLLPNLTQGKGGACLFAITPGTTPSVRWRSFKAVQLGREELILLEFLGFNPQLELPLQLGPSPGVPIVLLWLGTRRSYRVGNSHPYTKMSSLYQIDMKNTVSPLFWGRLIQKFTNFANLRQWRRVMGGGGGANECGQVLKTWY